MLVVSYFAARLQDFQVNEHSFQVVHPDNLLAYAARETMNQRASFLFFLTTPITCFEE